MGARPCNPAGLFLHPSSHAATLCFIIAICWVPAVWGLVFQFCNTAAVGVGLCLRPSDCPSDCSSALMAVSTLRCSQLYRWLWCNFTGLQPSSVTWGRLVLGTCPLSKEISQAVGIAVLVIQQRTVATVRSGGCSWPLSVAPVCLTLHVQLVNCCHPALEIATF